MMDISFSSDDEVGQVKELVDAFKDTEKKSVTSLHCFFVNVV